MTRTRPSFWWLGWGLLGHPTHSGAHRWHPVQTCRSQRRIRILASAPPGLSTCGAGSRDESSFTVSLPFQIQIARGKRITGYRSFLFQGQLLPSGLCHFVSWELGLETINLGAPKIWLDRNLGWASFVARRGWAETWVTLHLQLGSSPLLQFPQQLQLSGELTCLSLFFRGHLWVLDHERVTSLRTPLGSMELFSPAGNTYCLSRLKPNKTF